MGAYIQSATVRFAVQHAAHQCSSEFVSLFKDMTLWKMAWGNILLKDKETS